jgi:hypothetical protein
MRNGRINEIKTFQIMKNIITLPIVALLVVLSVTCEKQKDTGPDTLNLTGFIGGNAIELVNVKLKSGQVTSNPVGCYVLGSTLYDPVSGGYGYVDCHGMFYLMDPVSGDTLNSFPVPEFLSQNVIDTLENMLIGQCYEEGTNYVYKINLVTGAIEARNAVDLSQGILACTFFYRVPQQEYVLMGADSTLIVINPGTGEVLRTAKAATAPANGIYIAADDQLIGVTYDPGSDENFLVTLDAETGLLVKQVQIQERNDYYACMSSYDPETRCYILLNPDNRVLFMDPQTGEIKESYQIGFPIQEFKFWRAGSE